MADFDASTVPEIDDESMRLLSALCHELGNVLTATRLYAQFLTDGGDPETQAANAEEVDHLAGIASSLLMLVRPVVAPRARGEGSAEPRDVLERLQASLEPPPREMRVQVDIDSAAGLENVNLDADLLHRLIATLVEGAYSSLPDAGCVRVHARRDQQEILFVIEDEGEEDDSLAGFRNEALRGRPLGCAIVNHVLVHFDGRVEVSRHGSVTRIELRLSTA